MKFSKFKKAILRGEEEFKLTNDEAHFLKGTRVTLECDDGSDSPWFTNPDIDGGKPHCVAVYNIKRLKKNKKKEKENE